MCYKTCLYNLHILSCLFMASIYIIMMDHVCSHMNIRKLSCGQIIRNYLNEGTNTVSVKYNLKNVYPDHLYQINTLFKKNTHTHTSPSGASIQQDWYMLVCVRSTEPDFDF